MYFFLVTCFLLLNIYIVGPRATCLLAHGYFCYCDLWFHITCHPRLFTFFSDWPLPPIVVRLQIKNIMVRLIGYGASSIIHIVYGIMASSPLHGK